MDVLDFTKCKHKNCKIESTKLKKMEKNIKIKYEKNLDKLFKKTITEKEFEKQEKEFENEINIQEKKIIECSFNHCYDEVKEKMKDKLKIFDFESFNKYIQENKVSWFDFLKMNKNTYLMIKHTEQLSKCIDKYCKKEKKLADDKEKEFRKIEKKIINDFINKKITFEQLEKEKIQLKKKLFQTEEMINYLKSQIDKCYNELKEFLLFSITSKSKIYKNNKFLIKFQNEIQKKIDLNMLINFYIKFY